MPSPPSLIDDAKRAADSGAILFCATCIEAAFQQCDGKSLSEISSAANAVIGSTPHFFERAAAQADERLALAIHIMENSRDLATEEWLLLITDISSAFALTGLAERYRASITINLFHRAFEALRTLSGEFRDSQFLDQLRHARRNGFAPLPIRLS